MTLAVASEQGAAGTISKVWRVTNNGSTACHSFGFPVIEVQGPTAGWTTLQALHGGFPNIDGQPTEVTLAPGGSLYFATYWSDVPLNIGGCPVFDRIRVTLPGSATGIELATSAAICPTPARIGPVSASPPAG